MAINYTKTTWVNNSAPALNAANLNKIEQGIKDSCDGVDSINAELGTNPSGSDADVATRLNRLENSLIAKADEVTVTSLQAQIDRNFYDDYLRTLELYYTGHFSGADISGMKGMTFDGFLDTTRVNTGTTNAIVDTTNKYVKCTGTITYITPITAENVSGSVYGLTDNGSGSTYNDFSNLSNMIDGNDLTYAETYQTSSGTRYVVSKHDLGSTKFIKSVKAKAVSFGPTGAVKFNKLSYSTDGTNWTVVTVEIDLTWDTSSSEAWVEYVFDLPVNIRYFAIEWYYTTASTDLNNGIRVYTVSAGEFVYTNSFLYSTMKTLAEDAISAKLYISVKNTGDTDIIPTLSADNGVNYEPMTLESSRTDPLDPAYTERQYSITFTNTGNNLILKVALNKSTDNKQTPFIKRYGLHWA